MLRLLKWLRLRLPKNVETIKNTNDTLINSLDEMMRIHSEGSQKRLAAQQEIQRLEGELKNKMLEIASKR